MSKARRHSPAQPCVLTPARGTGRETKTRPEPKRRGEIILQRTEFLDPRQFNKLAITRLFINLYNEIDEPRTICATKTQPQAQPQRRRLGIFHLSTKFISNLVRVSFYFVFIVFDFPFPRAPVLSSLGCVSLSLPPRWRSNFAAGWVCSPAEAWCCCLPIALAEQGQQGQPTNSGRESVILLFACMHVRRWRLWREPTDVGDFFEQSCC